MQLVDIGLLVLCTANSAEVFAAGISAAQTLSDAHMHSDGVVSSLQPLSFKVMVTGILACTASLLLLCTWKTPTC